MNEGIPDYADCIFFDRDPREWLLIRQLLIPFPNKSIVKVVASRLDELRLERGLDKFVQMLAGCV